MVLTDLVPLWRGWCELHRERRIEYVSMGLAGSLPRPQPISRVERERWLDAEQLAGWRRTFADHLLRHLDDVYMEHLRERLSEEHEEAATDG